MTIFVMLGFVAGLTGGLAPSASAHLNTEAAAVVEGTVEWPALNHAGFDLPRDLNGCKLDGDHPDGPADGNSGTGLVVSGPQSDLCFLFGDLAIEAVGQYNGVLRATDFQCVSSGTSTASGAADGQITVEGTPVLPVQVGAFYGEFACDGNPLPVSDPPFALPTADGHFHGQSLAGGAEIAFLGVVECDASLGQGNGSSALCPPGINEVEDTDGNGLKEPGESPAHPNGKDTGKSAIKHTLSCKGSVAPLPTDGDGDGLPGIDKNGDGAPDTIVDASVTLECVIA